MSQGTKLELQDLKIHPKLKLQVQDPNKNQGVHSSSLLKVPSLSRLHRRDFFQKSKLLKHNPRGRVQGGPLLHPSLSLENIFWACKLDLVLTIV